MGGRWQPLRSGSVIERVGLQRAKLNELKQRNSVLEAQVLDLQNGLDAFEEKARNDLGMIKQGETFIQLIPGPGALPNRKAK